MANTQSKKEVFDPEGKSFEEILKHLEEVSDKIKQKDLTLDETIACYEEGRVCYARLKKILEETKQTIEVFEGMVEDEE